MTAHKNIKIISTKSNKVNTRKHADEDQGLKFLCKGDRIRLAKKCLKDNNTKSFYALMNTELTSDVISNCAYFAALLNRKEELNYLINRGVDSPLVVAINAAKGGHSDLVNDMIERFPVRVNPSRVAKAAAMRGHHQIVEDMISRGANLNVIAHGYATGGYREKVYEMIGRGAVGWTVIAHGAAYTGDRELLDDMISRGAKNWKLFAIGAARSGNIDIVFDMIDRADLTAKDYKWLIRCSTFGNNRGRVEDNLYSVC